jgi:aryl-alcohol dehydrogenase-like predicted oxidoreductase
METTTLGGSGVVVSRLGLGLAALGRPAYINVGHNEDLEGRRSVADLREHAHGVLDAALGAGVTYLDAARSYGKAEAFLADWLADRGVAAGAVTVGSKWGYTYAADWAMDAEVHEVKEHSRENLDRQIVESRSLLGRHLRVYQIHSATSESGVLDNPDVLARLAELRDGGLVVGLSTSGPDQADTIRRAGDIERGGSRLFGSVQATWNLLEPSAGSALSDVHESGMGVIVKEALANGRLTHRSPDIAGRLENSLPGFGPDAIALAAALGNPWADVVLSGAATPGQLADNLTALEVPHAALADLPEMAEDSREYWTTRSQLAWT